MALDTTKRPWIVTNISSQGAQWSGGESGYQYRFVGASITEGIDIATGTYSHSSVAITTDSSYQPQGCPSSSASGKFSVKGTTTPGTAALTSPYQNFLSATPSVPSGWSFFGWLTCRMVVGQAGSAWVIVAPGKSYSPSGAANLSWVTYSDGRLRVGSYELPSNNTTDPNATYIGKTAYTLWIPVVRCVPYIISYNANGGAGAPGNTTVSPGESWTCPSTIPTKSGYTFRGWNVSSSATSPTYVAGGTYAAISSNMTLYAVWTPNNGMLIYNANGGTVSPGYKAVAVGENYGTLPTPSRTGYNFTGWYTSASGGSRVSSSTTMRASSSVTIYAHWSATTTTHTLTFNTVGGTISSGSSTTRQVTEGAAFGTLPTATRSGYAFSGWFRSTVGSDQVTALTTMGNSDITVYAHWSESQTISYITFDVNEPDATSPEYSRQVV